MIHPQNDPSKLFLVYAKNLKHYLGTKPFTFEASYCVRHTMLKAQDLSSLCFYIPQLSFCIDWTDLMAKRTSDFNLIDYRLSDTELDAFEAWVKKSPPTFPSVMAELATMDYKVSLTFVENSESWCVSITGKEDAKFNSKATLTTWSEDVEEALLMAYFKVIVVFERGKWVGKAKSNRG